MDKFLKQITHEHTLRLFYYALNIWLLINTLILLPIASQLWGADTHILPVVVQNIPWFEIPLNLLSYPSLNPYYAVIVCGQILMCLFHLSGRNNLISRFLLFLFTTNLNHRAGVILDGGNNIIELLLLYSVFASQTTNIKSTTLARAQNLSSNVIFLIMRIQVVVVYLVAGLTKVTGELWPKGVALYYTFNVSEYGHPLLGELMQNFPLASVLGSYITLAFQLSFPYLVWNRTVRPFVLAVGTMLHLGISFGMGLVAFGFAMCVSYFIFYPNEKSQNILAYAQAKISTLFTLWHSPSFRLWASSEKHS